MSILDFASTSHWSAIGPSPIDTPGIGIGRANGRVEAAAPDPNHADIMFVNGSNGGIWKTGVWNNNPPVWLSLGDDFASMSCGGYHSLVVHPADSKLVLGICSGVGAGLLKSNPSTLSFQLLGNAFFEGASLGSIAVHPTDTDILYVSCWGGGPGGGVYKTTDGGLNWHSITTFHAGAASDVIVPRTNPETVYIGLVPIGSSGVTTSGVHKSTDGGTTWNLQTGVESGSKVGAKDGGGNFTAAIRLEAAAVAKTIYVALFAANALGKAFTKRYRTTDGGSTWKALVASPGTSETRSWHLLLAVSPQDANHVFANDAYKLFHSTDAGQNWASFEPATPIGDDWVNMSFDANHNAAVTSDQGIYRVALKTKAWTWTGGNLGVTQFYDITLDQMDPDKVYAIGQDQRRVMKASGSIEWKYLKTGSETGRVIVDPAKNSRLYVFSPQQVGSWVTRSIDGGLTWGTILTTAAFQNDDYGLAYSSQKSFVMDPTNAKRLLLGSNQIQETKNADAATPVWKVVGIPGNSQFITALATPHGKTIYAGTADKHLWVTRDAGASWSHLDNGMFGVAAGKPVDIRVDPLNDKHLFAVTSGGGTTKVWHLGPGTNVTQWENITGDLPSNLGVSAIFVDWQYAIPALWVGTSRGVYHSVNLGQNWTKFSVDFPNTNVTDLQGYSARNLLAASTSGRGAFEMFIKPSKISGRVIELPSNKPVKGALVFLETGGNKEPNSNEYKTTTDITGHYEFLKLGPGKYTPRVVPPEGFVQTASSIHTLTVNGSSVTARDIVVQSKVQVGLVTAPVHAHDLLPGQLSGVPISIIGVPDPAREK